MSLLQGCLSILFLGFMLILTAFGLSQCFGCGESSDKHGLGIGFYDIAYDLGIDVSTAETLPSRYDAEGKELKNKFYGGGTLIINTIGDIDNAREATVGVQWAKGDMPSVYDAIASLFVFSKTCAPDTVLTNWISRATQDMIEGRKEKGFLVYKDRTFTMGYTSELGALFLTCMKNGCPENFTQQEVRFRKKK